MSKSKSVGITIDKDWQTENDLSIIRKSKEIQSDKSRMKAVQVLIAKEQAALQQLQSPVKPKPKRVKR